MGYAVVAEHDGEEHRCGGGDSGQGGDGGEDGDAVGVGAEDHAKGEQYITPSTAANENINTKNATMPTPSQGNG